MVVCLQSGLPNSVFDQNWDVVLMRRIIAPGLAVMLGQVVRSTTYRYEELLLLPALEVVAKLDR